MSISINVKPVSKKTITVWNVYKPAVSIEFNTRTAEKKKSRTAEEGKFTLYLYIRFYTR